jgi:hypothetical protein
MKNSQYLGRSKEYKKIYARIHSNKLQYIKTFDKKEYQKEYYSRPYIRQRYNDKNLEIKLTLFNILGGICKHCGFSDHRALQLDHINGNGAKSRRENGLHKNRIQYYKFLINNPEYTLNEIQLLCANCNWVKRYDNNEVN